MNIILGKYAINCIIAITCSSTEVEEFFYWILTNTKAFF